MNSLISIPLGGKAIEHMRSWLGAGTLSRSLCELPLEAGSVETFLPSDTSADRVLQFDMDGLLSPEQASEATARVVQIIQAFLRQDKRHCAVFEDIHQEVGSPFLATKGTKWFSHGRAICHFAVGSDAEDAALIRQTVRVTSCYPFLCVLTSLPAGCRITLGCAVGEDTLRSFAEATQAIVMGAYDELSVIVWRRAQDAET